jgi:hypothetical protein
VAVIRAIWARAISSAWSTLAEVRAPGRLRLLRGDRRESGDAGGDPLRVHLAVGGEEPGHVEVLEQACDGLDVTAGEGRCRLELGGDETLRQGGPLSGATTLERLRARLLLVGHPLPLELFEARDSLGG